MAARLGIWDVDHLLEVMPFRLFNEWFEFDQMEPLNPFPRLEWMLGSLAALTHNIWASKENKLDVEDFIPFLKEPEKEMSPEDKKALLDFWALDLKIRTGQYDGPGSEILPRRAGKD